MLVDLKPGEFIISVDVEDEPLLRTIEHLKNGTRSNAGEDIFPVGLVIRNPHPKMSLMEEMRYILIQYMAESIKNDGDPTKFKSMQA